jgi:formylglycine-generating enzyme required for sulfatase activity
MKGVAMKRTGFVIQTILSALAFLALAGALPVMAGQNNATSLHLPGSLAGAPASGSDAATQNLYLPLLSSDYPLPFSEMVFIPAGSFQMGTYCNCLSYENPQHTVILDAYNIDKYEVTNRRFAACITAGGCTLPDYYPTGWLTPPFENPELVDYPVDYADWFLAEALCKWEGKRLPTEAEWEKAARGSNDTRLYPWGDTIDCSRANYLLNGKQSCVGHLTPVGSYPGGASPYGVMDMAGNVSEWVNDWFGMNYYCLGPDGSLGAPRNEKGCAGNDPPYLSPWYNPTGPAYSYGRVERGGSIGTFGDEIRVSSRTWNDPRNHEGLNGFRCARSPGSGD